MHAPGRPRDALHGRHRRVLRRLDPPARGRRVLWRRGVGRGVNEGPAVILHISDEGISDIKRSAVAVQPSSDQVYFAAPGTFSSIAAVRKSGYIGCNCGESNPACDGSCTSSARGCCDNSGNMWNVCEYYNDDVAAQNEDAPFEMAVPNVDEGSTDINSPPH